MKAVSIVPGAPGMLPENVGQLDVLSELRSDAVTTVHAASAGASDAVIVHGTDRSPCRSGLSWGERIGRHLLSQAGFDGAIQAVPVAWDADHAECLAAGSELARQSTPSTVVVVVADGSACRSEKAPGYLDPRAKAYDSELVGALEAADFARLAQLDADLGNELLALGRAPLQVLAAAASQAGLDWSTASLSAQDPFGVLYLVAELRSGDNPH